MEEYKDKSSYLVCEDDLSEILFTLEECAVMCQVCVDCSYCNVHELCKYCRFYNDEINKCLVDRVNTCIDLINNGFPQVDIGEL